jgi:hypothetical protein
MSSDDLFIIAMILGSAVAAGAITFALTGRDFKGTGRVLASLLSTFLVGATTTFVPWLPLLVFLGTMVVYLVMRHLLKPGLALAASAVVLLGGLALAVAAMAAALSTM